MKKLVLLLFLFTTSVLVIFSSGVVDSQDGFQYLAVARNIVHKGKPSAPVDEYVTRKNVPMSLTVGRDGDYYSLTGLGFSLAYVPAVVISDLVNNIYGIVPSERFPLESDWLILWLASFTNAVIGAGLVVVIFLYLLELGIAKKTAVFLSLVSLFCTNLLVYTKHSFAQMLFTLTMFSTFYALKVYSRSRNRWLMLLSGVFFGLNLIAYNPSTILAVPGYVVYYLFLIRSKTIRQFVKSTLIDIGVFIIGLLPFIAVYMWYENLKVYTGTVASSPVLDATESIASVLAPPISVFMEGVYGQLLSPGRSVFLYSPVLLVLIFFWFKFKKIIRPELVLFGVLAATYVFFYAAQHSVGRVGDEGILGLWHGESSWGPRYLIPLIPFAMLLVGYVYTQLSKKEKIFAFVPLLLIGVYVEILGVVFPYQTKYRNMEINFIINETNYPMYVYINLLPRYTPVLTQSKQLVKLPDNLVKSLDHGKYNVRFYDGFDFPFDVGEERWRTINGIGRVSFNNLDSDPVKNIMISLVNHPLTVSSASARLSVSVNNQEIDIGDSQIDIAERKEIVLDLKDKELKKFDNQLEVKVVFDDDRVALENKQLLGLLDMYINGERINKETLDFPYVSDLGKKLGVNYQTYGGLVNDPWFYWNIHTQIFERTPDFWWIKSLYYWDYPKKVLTMLLLADLACVVFFGWKLLKNLNK